MFESTLCDEQCVQQPVVEGTRSTPSHRIGTLVRPDMGLIVAVHFPRVYYRDI